MSGSGWAHVALLHAAMRASVHCTSLLNLALADAHILQCTAGAMALLCCALPRRFATQQQPRPAMLQAGLLECASQ